MYTDIWETDRQRHRGRQTETQRETDRQTDRDTEGDRQTERERDGVGWGRGSFWGSLSNT